MKSAGCTAVFFLNGKRSPLDEISAHHADDALMGKGLFDPLDQIFVPGMKGIEFANDANGFFHRDSFTFIWICATLISV